MADTIDINVNETVEEVTINVVNDVIQVNINKVTNTAGVPYVGATQDVNLGEFGLLTGNIELDNTPTNIPTTAGSIYWNDADGTADLILKGGNVKLQLGQEQVIRVVNKTATNVNLLESNYQAVRVTGAQGQRLKVDLAQATNDILSAETIGLVTETINNNQEGFITTSGLVRNINTTGSLQGETWADGDILYLSPTVAGRITKAKPTAPNHLVVIGYVIHAHATQGSIFVKVDNGYELDELHNVKITTPLNNESLVYNSTLEVWENKSIDLQSVLTEGNESIMPIVITDTVNSATLDKTLIELNDISTSNQVGFNTSGYYYINPTDGKTITINSSGFLVNNSVYNSEEITNNSIVYPLPTGATSQIATLLDIPSPITIDATPTDGSSNAVSSNGVFDALEERVRVIFSESADNATTATTAEQILSSKLISANTLKTNSVLKYIARIQRTNSNSSAIIKFYINTSNSLSGATQIGQGATMTSAILSQTIIRNFSLNSSSLLCGFPATQSSVSDYATTTNASFETTIDTTTDLYFITSVALNNASDIMTQRFNELTSSK